jgi:hypothetical protein
MGKKVEGIGGILSSGTILAFLKKPGSNKENFY